MHGLYLHSPPVHLHGWCLVKHRDNLTFTLYFLCCQLKAVLLPPVNGPYTQLPGNFLVKDRSKYPAQYQLVYGPKFGTASSPGKMKHVTQLLYQVSLLHFYISVLKERGLRFSKLLM